jgi:hypothetical protein
MNFPTPFPGDGSLCRMRAGCDSRRSRCVHGAQTRAYYEVLVQRAAGTPLEGARVRLEDRHTPAEGRTDVEGRVVIACAAPVVALFVDGRSEGLIYPGTTLITR